MTGIVVQARMGSSRLPGKILKPIGAKTLLEHIIFRIGFLQHKASLVIATTALSADDAVERFCTKLHIECFRGSAGHVLERYYLCARKYGFQTNVRLTGDNPFTDIEELNHLIDLYVQSGADFCHSFNSLPVGAGAEIFSFAALEKSLQNSKEPHHREHVDEYMLEHPEMFKILELSVPAEKKHPEARLTVATEADYKKACYIVEHATQPFVTTQEALHLCSDFE